MKFNYHNKRFKILANSLNGELEEDIVFHYQQQEQILSCPYSGGIILQGHLIGLVEENGIIQMRYHQINTNFVIYTGKCISTPEILPNGKIRLHERWEWTSGNYSKGESILEEI